MTSIVTGTPRQFVDMVDAVGYWLDGEWDSIAFVAECPDNEYLVRWGWWDAR